jgi:hypothetical protein
MEKSNYHISLIVNARAADVFRQINNVAAWWTDDLKGHTQKLHDEFTVQFGDVHVSTQKIVEFIPGKRVTWLVTHSKLNFIKDKQEWNNTEIRFDLDEKDGKTQIDFTHIGLVPNVECYESCVGGWDYYLKGSLYQLLTKGVGTPG